MLEIFLEIVGYWLGMGAIIALGMISSLYFAILCEKIVDRLFSR
jgi:hypothetical protein